MDKLLFFSNLHLPNTLKSPHFVIFNQFSAYGIKLQKRCIRFSVYLAFQEFFTLLIRNLEKYERMPNIMMEQEFLRNYNSFLKDS